MTKQFIFFVFIFIYASIFPRYLNAQNSQRKGVKTLPFSVYITKNDTLSIETILKSDFPSESLKVKPTPSEVYWIKVNFKMT
mgnify:CR=1 FL=1|tara:strand:+ start:8968 stop:9213 length:246 start_codon:yes stop_codon:yes gene_type:complete